MAIKRTIRQAHFSPRVRTQVVNDGAYEVIPSQRKRYQDAVDADPAVDLVLLDEMCTKAYVEDVAEALRANLTVVLEAQFDGNSSDVESAAHQALDILRDALDVLKGTFRPVSDTELERAFASASVRDVEFDQGAASIGSFRISSRPRSSRGF